MGSSPTFSVLVPVYNHAPYIGAALDSLLAQGDSDWEAIVVNDGSTDESPGILNGYAERHPRIRVLHQPNGGVANALNRGLREARGEWICWLSSDDLFEPSKLAVHRAAIARHPHARFFCSHFKTLEEPSGTVLEPPLWAPVPEPRWQVLEMLRCTYIQGNSTCVHRDAADRVGAFDETMRYGQDYDWFIRLVRLFPVVFIPHRTCIMRHHAAQGSQTFREACFFESARSTINLLNRHSFAELVPQVALENRHAASEAFAKALDVAANPGGFLNALGPNPGLVFRLIEWVWGSVPAVNRSPLVQMLIRRASVESELPATPAFGLFWKTVSAAVSVQQGRFQYPPISASDLAKRQHAYLDRCGSPGAAPLKKYLKECLGIEPVQPRRIQGRSPEEVVFVCHKNARFGSNTYGTMRVTLEAAKRLEAAGNPVVLAGWADQSLGFVEGLLYVAGKDDDDLKKIITELGVVDTVIAVSRADILNEVRTRRFAIFQMGPHPPLGASAATINSVRAPVCCVSNESVDAQIRWGINRSLLHVVPPGFDDSLFFPAIADRRPQSIMYVGNVMSAKGVDIALRAFELLKRRFPDSTFSIFGKQHRWSAVDGHFLRQEWLSDQNDLNWETIAHDLPGCQYRGHVAIADLAAAFRSHSLLVLPSRGSDTFGLVSVEAQACGCIPILPINGCGFAETLQDDVTGHLYQPNTPKVLAMKIAALWEAGRPTLEERAKAQEWVATKFSWDHTVDALLSSLDNAPPWSPHWRTSVFCAWHRARGRALTWAVQEIPAARRLHRVWRRQ